MGIVRERALFSRLLSDFEDEEDDISLLSLRKELEREDFEDEDEDEDDIILEF